MCLHLSFRARWNSHRLSSFNCPNCVQTNICLGPPLAKQGNKQTIQREGELASAIVKGNPRPVIHQAARDVEKPQVISRSPVPNFLGFVFVCCPGYLSRGRSIFIDHHQFTLKIAGGLPSNMGVY